MKKFAPTFTTISSCFVDRKFSSLASSSGDLESDISSANDKCVPLTASMVAELESDLISLILEFKSDVSSFVGEFESD